MQQKDTSLKTLSAGSWWALAAIAVILVAVSSNLNWGKRDYWKNTIASDGKGYYAYLPALFIYYDMNFGFFDSLDRVKYYDEHTFYDYRTRYKDKVIDKYYCGTAVAELPFFLAAHGITKAQGGDADGYSKWYQIAVGLAAMFWLLFGLFYLDRTLALYHISAWNRAIVLFVAVFGTHVFYYTLVEPAMSHVYSLAFVSWFVFLSKKYLLTFNPRLIPGLALAFGMVLLIRPVNGLVLLAWPFLAGDFFVLKRAVAGLFKKPVWLSAALTVFAGVVSVQLFLYKASVGEYFIYAYGNEGFNWLHPHMGDMLFSYKKGLFLYTPVLLVSFFGLYFLGKESPFSVWTWALFFLLLTYIFSCWWMWFFGGSFSARVFVEYVPLFMILLGIALRDVRPGWRRTGFVALLFALLAICQIQTYQYRYYQIHWSDMTGEKYWDVFLRPDKI